MSSAVERGCQRDTFVLIREHFVLSLCQREAITLSVREQPLLSLWESTGQCSSAGQPFPEAGLSTPEVGMVLSVARGGGSLERLIDYCWWIHACMRTYIHTWGSGSTRCCGGPPCTLSFFSIIALSPATRDEHFGKTENALPSDKFPTHSTQRTSNYAGELNILST